MPFSTEKIRRAIAMHQCRFVHILLTFLIAGCVTVSEMNKMKSFDRTAIGYREAIRWSDFETAYRFTKNSTVENNLQAFKKLNPIKVTSYEVKQTITAEDRSQVRQIVEIKYYNTDDMVERTLRDHQLWEYDETMNGWILQGNLPDF